MRKIKPPEGAHKEPQENVTWFSVDVVKCMRKSAYRKSDLFLSSASETLVPGSIAIKGLEPRVSGKGVGL